MQPNHRATVIILRKDDRICLPRILRGWCAPYRAGVGGKVEGEETETQCAVREVGEELGVIVHENDLCPIGTADDILQVNGDPPLWRYSVAYFFAETWKGVPQKTAEADPHNAWFDWNRICASWNEFYPSYTKILPMIMQEPSGPFSFSIIYPQKEVPIPGGYIDLPATEAMDTLLLKTHHG